MPFIEVENFLIILFYLAVFLLVYTNRKKLDIHAKFIVMWRTQLGISLMDRIGKKYAEFVKLLGYIGVGVGFISMIFIVGMILVGFWNLFFNPSAPPVIQPIIPGVTLPDSPIDTPFIETILAIFIVAIIHEFAHGVVARAHNIKVKNSGPALFGPILAAFVEPDEKAMKKRHDIENYSVFAAGSFSNILSGVLFFFLALATSFLLVSFFTTPEGVIITDSFIDLPAADAGVPQGLVVTTINNQPVSNGKELRDVLQTIPPNSSIVLANENRSYVLVSDARPDNPDASFIGVNTQDHRTLHSEDKLSFQSLFWINRFLNFLFIFSLGIGIANMIPVGPIDGGRMFLLASRRIFGEERGTKVWVRTSFMLLFIVLLLIIKALFPLFVNLFNAISVGLALIL